MLRFKTFEELLENEGLKKKAAKSGISYGTLKKVYNRGMAAWRTGHRPGTTPQQWGMARVNSYIGKGKGTYYGADADLSGKGKKKKESVGEALDKKDVIKLKVRKVKKNQLTKALVIIVTWQRLIKATLSVIIPNIIMENIIAITKICTVALSIFINKHMLLICKLAI